MAWLSAAFEARTAADDSLPHRAIREGHSKDGGDRVCFEGTESMDQLVEAFLAQGQMFAYDGKDKREPMFESPVQAVLVAWSLGFPCPGN